MFDLVIVVCLTLGDCRGLVIESKESSLQCEQERINQVLQGIHPSKLVCEYTENHLEPMSEAMEI